jgi:hypothetical protein
MKNQSKLTKATCVLALWVLTIIVGAPIGFAQDKCETIDATAQGTSTQLGKIVSIKIMICGSSTPEDRQVLVDAFKKGKNQGLADALQKMKGVGRISLPGTVGYDLAYIRVIPTATGREIRFVTNRRISIGEAYYSTRSQDYSLTAGRLLLDDTDKTKSAGDLYPAAELKINKKGELEWNLYQNPWKLRNIIDWKNGEKE